MAVFSAGRRGGSLTSCCSLLPVPCSPRPPPTDPTVALTEGLQAIAWGQLGPFLEDARMVKEESEGRRALIRCVAAFALLTRSPFF